MIEITAKDKMQEKQLMRPLSACVLVEVFYFRGAVHKTRSKKCASTS